MMPDEKSMYRSLLGAVLSIITVIVMLSYSVFKMVAMGNLNDYKIKTATQEYFYDSSFSFSELDGFQVAAGITSFDGNSESIEDPEIGVVKFYLK